MLASTIGQIAHPFYVLFALVLSGAYSLVPNYAVAIALLTIVVMVVVFPITLRGTRGMMRMQLLAPEIKKLQAKYKTSPGMTVAERQEARQRQQEEMMALYKENNVNPTGGCLPMLLQMPIFLILYGTIRGLLHTVKGPHGTVLYEPLYISTHTKLYHAVRAAHGNLHGFGINLADSVRSTGLSGVGRIPFIALILVAIGLQYVQMKQLSGRNPQAAQANPQMQQMQKVFPIVFALIYISIPAAVNIYFIVSSLFRIGQQEFMYRRDPHIQEAMAKLRARNSGSNNSKVLDVKLAGNDRPKGVMGRLAQLTGQMTPATEGGVPSSSPSSAPRASTTPPRANGNSSSRNRSKSSSTSKGRESPPQRGHPRSQGKRPRRPR